MLAQVKSTAPLYAGSPVYAREGTRSSLIRPPPLRHAKMPARNTAAAIITLTRRQQTSVSCLTHAPLWIPKRVRSA